MFGVLVQTGTLCYRPEIKNKEWATALTDCRKQQLRVCSCVARIHINCGQTVLYNVNKYIVLVLSSGIRFALYAVYYAHLSTLAITVMIVPNRKTPPADIVQRRSRRGCFLS